MSYYSLLYSEANMYSTATSGIHGDNHDRGGLDGEISEYYAVHVL